MPVITRSKTIDAGHRVMNQAFKCHNLHGHTYKFELSFSYVEPEDIGYAIDFSEIKRIAFGFLDQYLDHGMILNPQDNELVSLCRANNWKYWLMSLKALAYCNPTVENIAEETFYAMNLLFANYGIEVHNVRIHETPSCYVDFNADDIDPENKLNFETYRADKLAKWLEDQGTVEYDDRKSK